MKFKDYIWPVIGILAVIVSAWLLYRELRSISLEDVLDSLYAIRAHHWLLATAAALLAYSSLAGYDRIALLHLRRKISWLFIALCSFTTYALSHNIGASVVSGAVVRYRAYSSQGMPAVKSLSLSLLLIHIHSRRNHHLQHCPAAGTAYSDAFQLGPDANCVDSHRLVDAGFCSTLYLRQLVTITPTSDRQIPPRISAFASCYTAADRSPARTDWCRRHYLFRIARSGQSRLSDYSWHLPVSFSAALISHAPGGLGVLELVFLTGLPDMDQADVLAALIVFRLLYLLIPFAMSLIVVLVFEKSQFVLRWNDKQKK